MNAIIFKPKACRQIKLLVDIADYVCHYQITSARGPG